MKKEGFVTVVLVPFLSLMILCFSGLFLMGWGIKNITKSQTACIIANLKAQKKLGELLKKLMNLNKSSESLNRKRKAVQIAMATALGSGNLPAYAVLKKVLKFIKLRQKLLIFRQKTLIAKSETIKMAAIKKFRFLLTGLKVKNIYEITVFKKALAVRKKRIGKEAYIYTPVEKFSKAQATVFSWELNPLAQADTGILNIFSSAFQYFGKYNCSATLKKNRDTWKARLSH